MAVAEGHGQPPLAGAEPVAVIGVGCRFAGGATSPARYWEMLHAGRDGIGLLPEERWRPYADMGGDFAAALRRATRWGGFLPDIEGFDAEFFGLSPREAELMDPQQRLLLEVAWEALEHAGIPPQSLAASDTGVFVGVGSDDYGRRLLEHLPSIEAWTGIGSAMCGVANRISYALDLRGPSLAVDTACSASMVALHLACQSVRTGESPVALAAGVNLVISPGLTLTLDAAGATAPDGRCKSFDVTANGYGRGEGGGVLVLKRLSDARRDGDRVLATILGSAVNQDGRTNGIMAPNAEAQRHVLARACAQAGVDPRSVDYVEAHGTGTRLGDPLEASALSAVYGAGREPGEPCLIGSVKSNIGHLEAGAGVAGVIKAVLALNHGEIPPTLNHTTGNPAIDWDSAGLRVVTEPTPWPRTNHPRRAGVSAFGYGGTVAHLVLEQAPPSARREPAMTGAAVEERLFPLSAASEAGLRDQAGELAAWLSDPSAEGTLADVGHTLGLRRSHLSRRAAVVAGDREELVARLRRIADGRPGEGIASGAVPAGPGKGLVWVFSGHGSQWTGMGRELLAAEPAFATVVDTLAPVFLREIGFSPRAVLDEVDLVEIDQIQTMIFVMQVGLAEVWRSYGVTPDAVIGHSVGEIAAAVVSGALTLEDGAVLICRRSRLLRRVAGQGAMAMVGLGFDEVARRLSGRADVVAAIASSPLSTVVAGDPAAVAEVMGRWAAEDINVRRVASDVAFHSPHMDPLLADLGEAASGLSPASPRIPMYSTSMPERCTTPLVDNAYWVANLRSPVRLVTAVQAAAEDGYRTFLEISSHPVVAHSIGETLADTYADAFVGASLRRDQPERATLLANAGALYCHGIGLDWARAQPVGELVTLPTVAWQRRPLWRDTRPGGAGLGFGHDGDSHTLLGTEVPVGAHGMRLWRTLLDESCRPYPGSHTINGVEIIPAAILINTLLRAAADGEGMPVLKEVALRVPLTDEPREVQVSCADGVLRLASQAQDRDTGAERPWLVHTSALVAAPHAATLPSPVAALEDLAATAEDPAVVQRHLASVGVPTMAFDWTVEELHRCARGLRARVRAEPPDHRAGEWAPLLDAALSVAPVADPVPALRMVAGVREVRIVGDPPETAVIDIVVDDAGSDLVDVSISDGHGVVLATLTGLRYAGMPDVAAGSVAPQHLVHETVWRELELAAADGQPYHREVVLVSPDPQTAGDWQQRLSTAGARVRVVSDPAALGGRVPAPGASTDVLLLPSVSGGTAAEAAARATWLLVSTAQCLAGGPAAQAPRLWCLTTGVRDGRTEAGLALAPLWGLGRVLRTEHPELWGGIMDVTCGDDVPADIVLRLFATSPAEDVISFRDGVPEVARITAVEGAPTRAPFTCQADGTYLITGGLGALGLEVAQWLVERGARRLVLTGRRALPPRATWDHPADDGQREQIKVVRDLEALGVTVRSVALDIADAERAAVLLDTDGLGLPPIRGVVHAAGVLDNRMLADVDEESVRTVMRPKAAGAWTLHELFPPGTLDFFVLFSSCGQLLGMPGQSTYGPANVFLDALAAFRQATDGDQSLSLGWTSWRSKGMSVNEVVDLELRARGVAAISVREAFDAWDWAHRHGGAHFTVLRVLPVEPGMERPVVLSETVAGAGTDDAVQAGPGQAADFSGLTPEALHSRLLAEVTERIVAEMGMSSEDLDPRRSLSEQGLDSVMTIVVRRSLESRFRRVLPAALLWHQPTVTAIADHLAELLIAEEEERVAAAGVST
ncbi:type I polyketide synthase [Micromonospora eburnea]|uniref:6-methylsalicylic acid synthase n=1 Tax=Micromonospora eburnea TaxID=227316 RepID=A0A1C6V0K9_9ACTN|nr:type I polyketide synthase [Micromonospora eburnea]SCL59836.1 6-methylsalicylic acid synthase [Micromonospora eburnea]